MRIDIVTTFPHIFDSYFQESIIGRAQERRLLTIATHNPRDFTSDRHRTTDDKPYGGGAGMVMLAEPILKAAEQALRQGKVTPRRRKVIVFSAKGIPFTQAKAQKYARQYSQIVLVSGRYEGIDERVRTILRAEEVSIGPYVLTDGDVAAMVLASAVVRLVPGVITAASLLEESFSLTINIEQKTENVTEYPHYTRPEVLRWKGKNYRVPKELLSGNHKAIAAWRERKRHHS